MVSSGEKQLQIVIIDFGKATLVSKGKHYHLNEIEKSEYFRCYSHISPEVIEGITGQSKMSDIYAVGGILQKIVSSDLLRADNRKAMDDLATKCRSPKYLLRPSAHEGLESLKKIV